MGGAVLVDVGVKDTMLKLVRCRNSKRAAAFVGVPAQNANAVRSFPEPGPNLLLKRRRRRVKLREINTSLDRQLLTRQLNRSVSKRDPALDLLKLVDRIAVRRAQSTLLNPLTGGGGEA